MRAIWCIVISLIAYYALTTALTLGLTYLISRLFEAWGVTSNNIGYTPDWIRYLAAWYPFAVSCAVNAIVALIAHRAVKSQNDVHNGVGIPIATCAAGILAAAVPAGLFILVDSIRLLPGMPNLAIAQALYIPVFLSAACAEQFFARGYVFTSARKGRGRFAAYAASAVALCMMTTVWNGGVIAAINTLLMSVILCGITERYGAWVAILARAGWSWSLNSLIGVTEGAMFRTYPVSEKLLTGGSGGIASGLFLTLMLMVGTALLFRKEISTTIRKIGRR